MHRIDIDEQGENYIVTFEMPGIREENILIKGEAHSLNVRAINTTVTTEMREGKVDIDFNSVFYDKTAVLEIPDFTKMTYVFFAGWLEVTVPKNYEEEEKSE